MRKEYKRASLTVSAEQYEMNKGLEDGFELYKIGRASCRERVSA